jgi:hypothetical protein
VATTFLACPFCRELYEVTEAEVCPVCGVALRGLGELPPSYEVQAQLAREWEQTPPEDRRLPWTYWRQGRGALVLCSLAGIGLFFAPWIVMTLPDTLTLSGFDMAHTRGFWFAGGATAWLVNIPLVLSRRSINQMLSVRIVTTVFSALTACQGVLLLLASPTESLVPVRYSWGWGFYASLAVSALATLFALRFGAGQLQTPRTAKETAAGATTASRPPLTPRSRQRLH